MAEKLGPYILERRIGAGGMADVFLAKGPRGTCVVKKPHPHLCANPDFVRMFLSEAAILAQLHHPGIAEIYDLGQVNGVYYLAMEYVPGFDLMTISLEHERQGELMSPELCARIVADAAGALHYAHEAKSREGQPLNIIHRDVTPHNILLSTAGVVKIIDFGVAKASNAMHRTQAGLVKGKYPYMSPEQVTGQEIDRRVDVYALGLVLYELLTNVRAIQGNLEVEQIDNARASRIRPIEQLRPNIPEPLRLILGGCLHPDPAGRYPTAQHVKEDLEKYLLYERRQLGQNDLLRLFKIVASEVAVSEENVVPEDPAQASTPSDGSAATDNTWTPSKKTEVEQPASAVMYAPGVAPTDDLKALGHSRTEPSFKKPKVPDAPVAPAEQPGSLRQTTEAPVQPTAAPPRSATAALAANPELAPLSLHAPVGDEPLVVPRSNAGLLVGLGLFVVVLAGSGWWFFGREVAPEHLPVGVDLPLVADASVPEVQAAGIEVVDAGPTVAAVEPEAPGGVDAGVAEVKPPEPVTPPSTAMRPNPAPKADLPKPPPAKDLRAAVVPVDTDPLMDVAVDGKKYGRSPIELELAAGRHSIILVNKEANLKRFVTLELKPGEKKPIILRLKKGTLDLNATPFAVMFVNGVQVCAGLSHQRVELYEGSYSVEFVVNDPSLPKELRKKEQAEVKPGETTTLNVNMLQ